MTDDPIDFSDGAMYASLNRPPTTSPFLARVVASTLRTPAPVPLVPLATEPQAPRCPACGVPYTTDTAHTQVIFVNRRQVEMTFCSASCAGNYQMGCEG